MAELADLKAQLSDLYTSVLTDMIEPKTGAVLAQITNAQIRITEVELRVREQQELEVCLEELEEVLEAKKGSNQWGA
jgi:CRISPR/Cas system-associated exonuclease Cas4 (RecB family)